MTIVSNAGIQREALELLEAIAGAASAIEAMDCRERAANLVLRLKASSTLRTSDMNNLLTVFDAALEKRLLQLG